MGSTKAFSHSGTCENSSSYLIDVCCGRNHPLRVGFFRNCQERFLQRRTQTTDLGQLAEMRAERTEKAMNREEHTALAQSAGVQRSSGPSASRRRRLEVWPTRGSLRSKLAACRAPCLIRSYFSVALGSRAKLRQFSQRRKFNPLTWKI